MSEYFPEPKPLRKVKVELDLPNMQHFKNVTGIDISSFAKKVDLADLNSNVGKLELIN